MLPLQLPPCDADLVLQAVPATQLVPPRLLSDVTSSGNKSRPAPAQTRPPAAAAGQTDEEAELEAAMLLSLAETSGSDGGPANIDSEQLARVMEMQRQGGWGPGTGTEGDEDMEMALRMSAADQGGPGQATSEEDEIQRAIALSLEGGAVGGAPASATSGGGGGGWGSRLRQQELEEEARYREEQEAAAKREEDELQRALAMSMEAGAAADTNTRPPPAASDPKPRPQLDPVHAAWPQVKNPAPGTVAGPPKPKPPSSMSSASSIIQKSSKVPEVQSATSAAASTSKPSSSETASPSRPSLQNYIMPEGEKQDALSFLAKYYIFVVSGPGHRLGSEASPSTAAAGSRGASATVPGAARSGPGQQPRSEDPEEIRRRRMAFLDKLQKSPPSQ